MEQTITISAEEYKNLKSVAKRWDDLNDKISDFYETYDDAGNEIPPKRQGDLVSIGELAAMKFGYL